MADQNLHIDHKLPRRSTTPPSGGGKPSQGPQAWPHGDSVVTTSYASPASQDQSNPLWMRTWNALMEERHTLERLLNTEHGLDERTSLMLTRLRHREEELCTLIRAIEAGTFRSNEG